MYLKVIKERFHYKEDVKTINLRNDRVNIRYSIKVVESSSGYSSLDFIRDSVKTIVYFNSRNNAEQAVNHLRNLSAPDQRDEIVVYHEIKAEDFKRRAMERFKSGDAKIMMAVEAAGMGCGIRDIVRIGQFGCPNNISTLVQRFGRAARDSSIRGFGILTVTKHQLSKLGKGGIASEDVGNEDEIRSAVSKMTISNNSS
ncbi:ATP-dependent DNA helicase sgs1 [Lobosporangium transversale]|nr:ATP-dependent DNA helicase sgs1 [Lobosporangium transversale]